MQVPQSGNLGTTPPSAATIPPPPPLRLRPATSKCTEEEGEGVTHLPPETNSSSEGAIREIRTQPTKFTFNFFVFDENENAKCRIKKSESMKKRRIETHERNFVLKLKTQTDGRTNRLHRENYSFKRNGKNLPKGRRWKKWQKVDLKTEENVAHLIINTAALLLVLSRRDELWKQKKNFFIFCAQKRFRFDWFSYSSPIDLLSCYLIFSVPLNIFFSIKMWMHVLLSKNLLRLSQK